MIYAEACLSVRSVEVSESLSQSQLAITESTVMGTVASGPPAE